MTKSRASHHSLLIASLLACAVATPLVWGMGGGIGGGMAIQHLDIVAQRLKAMREAFWDQERAPVVGAELLGMPL